MEINVRNFGAELFIMIISLYLLNIKTIDEPNHVHSE